MSVSLRDESARTDDHPLDNPFWSGLTGPWQQPFVQRAGRVARYHPDVSVFAAAAPDADPASVWAELADLVGPGNSFSLADPRLVLPADWTLLAEIPGVQLVDTGMRPALDPEARPLGPDDVPDMLDLVERTRPGPFLPRTIELGGYLGIRRDGVLAAMAGERLRPPGWTEISAVCTDPAYRGQGLAGRLVRAVAAGIRDRGETPFLHTGAANTNAIRRYESLGFRLRQRTTFRVIRVPG